MRIIKQGKKIKSQNLSMFFLKNDEGKYRVGISVSKKVSKLAVIRNKIKRQISAIVDLKFDKNNMIDLVIIPRDSVKELSFNDLSLEIESCFKRII